MPQRRAGKRKAAPEKIQAEKRPVAVLAMGDSRDQFEVAAMVRGNYEALGMPDDLEIWAINTAGTVYKCDRVYHMDPLAMYYDGISWTAETEAHGRAVEFKPWPAMGDKLAALPVPIYTSVSDKRFPNSVDFPIREVAAHFGNFSYYNTTVAYAIAHAIYEGRKTLYLYGCDFSYPDKAVGESGRSCAEYWIGQAIARGIKVMIPKCTLLDNWRDKRPLYGYGKTLEEVLHATDIPDSDGDGSD